MYGVEVGILSVFIILILIYCGVHVAVSLGLVSFIGVWGAGLIVDSLGSYDRAWQIAVFIGIGAGIAQIFANDKPTDRIGVPAPA